MKPLTFRNGIPTKPDVQRLLDAFKVPDEGQIITYKEVAQVINEESEKTARFRTVATAWRNLLFREHNCWMACEPKVGFVAATPSERVHEGSSRIHGGMRRISKASVLVSTTSRKGLTAEEAKVADHLALVASAIKLAVATEAKRLKAPSLDRKKEDKDSGRVGSG